MTKEDITKLTPDELTEMVTNPQDYKLTIADMLLIGEVLKPLLELQTMATKVKEKLTLSKREKEVLQALNVLGFEYIARDSNSKIYAYDFEPEAADEYDYYISVGDICLTLNNALFQFIKPTECKAIEEILENETEITKEQYELLKEWIEEDQAK